MGFVKTTSARADRARMVKWVILTVEFAMTPSCRYRFNIQANFITNQLEQKTY